jgi:hypothetical protein
LLLANEIGVGPKPRMQKVTLSTVEQYLAESRPADDLSIGNFESDPISKAVMILPGTNIFLKGMGLSEQIGRLASALGDCVQCCSSGKYDCVWLPPPVSTTAAAPVSAANPKTDKDSGHKEKVSKGHAKDNKDANKDASQAEASTITEAEEGQLAELGHSCREMRSSLVAETLEALRLSSKNCVPSRLLFESCVVLSDIFGNCDPSSASAWLLQLQSLSAREYMLHVWKESLNPACEVANALDRLQDLQAKSVPTSVLQKQIESEITFLSQCSVAWRRLDVSADPASILSLPLANKPCYFSLQVCPYQRHLLLCAGQPSLGSQTAVSTYKLPGSWVVDKV